MAAKPLLKNVRQSKILPTEVQEQFDDTVDQQSDSFLGLGKKARARKDAKKAAKTDIKQAKADRIRAEGQAKLILANQGIATPDKPTALQSIVSSVGSLASGIFGGGQQQQAPEQTYQEQPLQYVDSSVQRTAASSAGSSEVEGKKDNTMLYVAIAIAAAVLLFVILRKK